MFKMLIKRIILWTILHTGTVARLLPCRSSSANILIMETVPLEKVQKKDVGVKVSSRAYPWSQALALPLYEDKQRWTCPRQLIIWTPGIPSPQTHIYTDNPCQGVHLINIYKGMMVLPVNYNHPRGRLCCITAAYRFKFSRFDFHRQVTFENVL